VIPPAGHRAMIVASRIMPASVATPTPQIMAAAKGNPWLYDRHVPYAPSIISSPCARLTTPIMPKMTASPTADKSRNAAVEPNWRTNDAMSISHSRPTMMVPSLPTSLN
jgi:hypothetical protein